MRQFLVAFLAVLPLAVLGAVTVPDESFFNKAAQGGMAEVENGKMAQERASSQEVRDFGALMVKDHSAANEKLQRIAESKSITLPSGPSVTQTAEHDRLKLLSGATFDRSYMRSQIRAHEDTATLFKKEIATGEDGPAKSFASDTLPVVQSHLDKARKIYDGLPK